MDWDKDEINGIIQLEGDILLSVDEDDKVFTWHATTGTVIESIGVRISMISCINALEIDRVLIVNCNGSLALISNLNSLSFEETKTVLTAHKDTVNNIVIWKD